MLSRITWASPIRHCKILKLTFFAMFIDYGKLLQPALRHLENWTRPTFTWLHRNVLWAQSPLGLEGICAYERSEGLAFRSDLARRTASVDSVGFHSSGEIMNSFSRCSNLTCFPGLRRGSGLFRLDFGGSRYPNWISQWTRFQTVRHLSPGCRNGAR